jgi:hypothetical protein
MTSRRDGHVIYLKDSQEALVLAANLMVPLSPQGHP